MKLNPTWAYSPLLILMVACSKGHTNKIITTSPLSSNTSPLPNTVDKSDTLQVMAYNVLNYGDGCQGSAGTLDGNFKTIVQYVQPDLMSCEKMNSFDPTPGAPGNLADEIKNNVLNAVFSGRYGYAPPTNAANAGDMSVLFYNLQKLSYVSRRTLVVNVTDFNLYKFYYNDPNLSITRDTTYLYVVVNHTQSGSNSAIRDQQVTQEMQALRTEFGFLPNLVNMGDFNTRNSLETGYQAIVTFPDTATVMNDPPFSIEKAVQYPANWDVNPNLYAPFLTTSTRLSATLPNSCGTSGGGKSWYDHIFISPWLVKGSNYIQYLPGSYRTIGNDGLRLGVDINSKSTVTNSSAPDSVIQALWQFSNKYPISIRLVVKANRNAYSPADPFEKN